MEDEFRTHISLRAEDLERRGMSREVAERTARIEFGNLDWQKDVARASAGLRPWDEFRSSMAFSMRGIVHRPIQSLVILLTLAIGIGVSASVFSVINAVALRPRVDSDPASFVRLLSSYRTDSSTATFPSATTLDDYLTYARELHSLSAITGWQRVSVATGESPTPTPAVFVTCGFFDVYRTVAPLAGRMLQPEDCASRVPVVVISDVIWSDEFGASPDVIGRTIRINDRPLRIVGVAPAFSSVGNDDKLWIPYSLRGYLQLGTDEASSPDAMHVFVDGRIKQGRSRADVAAEARVVAAQQDQLKSGRRTAVFVTDGSLLDKPGNGVVVTGIVALVFAGLACLALVACANVVSILLAVAHTRRSEMALRMALGAGARRLGGMLATEALVLATLAGIVAAWITFKVPRLLLEWILNRETTYSLAPDWHVFAFLSATTLCAALIAANAPIRAILALDLNSILRGASSESGVSRGGNRLVGAQIGGAAALLVATIALTRLPARIASAPPHFETKRVSAMNVRAPRPANGWQSLYADIGRTLAAVPGVARVAFATAIPVGDESIGSIAVTTARNARRTLPSIDVSPEYFDVLGVRIERGRSFATSDVGCTASVCPVVVSRETARELWGSADPLGQRLTIDRSHAFEVVGVATDAASDIANQSQSLMLYQAWRPDEPFNQPFIRVDRDADAVARAAATALIQRFPGLIAAPKTLDAELSLVTDAFQRVGGIVGGVAMITALLAIVGVYGVIALAAKRRLKEMGIRIALGAKRADIYRAMIAPNARPVAIGLVVGATLSTLLAVGSDRLLASIFPVRIFDPLAFVVAAIALAAAATLAMFVPARRATGVDPSRILHQD